MKKMVLKIILGVVLLFILVVGGYVVYLFTSYYRLPDNLELEVKNNNTDVLKLDTSYRATSFNIGFGAYSQNFSFFMDDGKYSRGYSQEEVEKNMTGITSTIKNLSPTISFFQEVDVSGDRSRHVNQVADLRKNFSTYSSVFAQNYDSAYLFYPFTQPIGQAKSGLLTLGKSKFLAANRFSLPIETNLNKFTDLDRAYSVTYAQVEQDKQLVLINIHLSAFTKDPKVHDAQLTKLFKTLQAEYEKGHYVLVAGDYNHDLLGDAPEVFGTTKVRETWTHPFPVEDLPEHFSIPTTGLREAKIPSVRASNIAYDPAKSYISLVDGFIVSDNIQVEKVQVQNEEFMNSDHNPVTLDFKLRP